MPEEYTTFLRGLSASSYLSARHWEPGASNFCCAIYGVFHTVPFVSQFILCACGCHRGVHLAFTRWTPFLLFRSFFEDTHNLQEWLLNTFTREQFVEVLLTASRLSWRKSRCRLSWHYCSLAYEASPLKIYFVGHAMVRNIPHSVCVSIVPTVRAYVGTLHLSHYSTPNVQSVFGKASA